VSWYANREGWLASDDDDEFALVRAGATADFDVCRYRLARLQKVGWGEMPRWLLYLKAEGQYTGSPLVPTEQFAVGGMRSVRGYNERETVGDKGILLSAELRTPLLNHGNFQNWFNVLQDEVMNLVMSTPRPNEREEVRQTAADTIQFLLFCDYGHVTRIAPGAGEFTNADLCSVGAGIRLSLWNRLQMRVDYGVPLHNSPDELEDAATELSGNGALHVGLTLQF
jgi:hemolysin activation/secretion protein